MNKNLLVIFRSLLNRSPKEGESKCKPEMSFDLPQLLAEQLIHNKRRITLCLDYDGTLFPIVRRPELAYPDPSLQKVLRRLASKDRIDIHIVSGRRVEDLESWFGSFPISLHAEHGAHSKWQPSQQWVSNSVGETYEPFFLKLQADLELLLREVPGSFIERKQNSLVWHYRAAADVVEEAFEPRLSKLISAYSDKLELLAGKKVFEFRVKGVSKSNIIHEILRQDTQDHQLVSIGDDLTDEEMFRACGVADYSIVVGEQPSVARFRFQNTYDVRQFLSHLDLLAQNKFFPS